MEKDSRNVKIFKIVALFVGGWLVAMNIQNLFAGEPANLARTWGIIAGAFFVASLILYFWIKDEKKVRVKLAFLFPIIVLLITIAIIFFPLWIWSAGRYG